MNPGWMAALLVLLAGCNTASRVVRLDTGQADTLVFIWTWTTYMVLVSIPDVTVSKGLAAVMTATLISYVGVDTFWGLVVGFKRLMEEAERATTFSELREAGERYGKVMGRNAARAFAMLATAAMGNTAPGLAAKVPMLPGSVQAAAQARTHVGIRLAAVGAVESVTVSAESVTIALAPEAVAMSARGSDGSDAPPKSALEIAEVGGKHAGFLKNYQGKSPEELRRGIASLQKQIALHKDKIANPDKHIPNWSSLDPRQQEALVQKKWPSDIQRQAEQLDILEGLLKALKEGGPP
jgi:hypothetical protein